MAQSTFNSQIDGGIIYDNIMTLCESYRVAEVYAGTCAFQGQNLGSLTIEDLEDLKQYLFGLIEDIDGTIAIGKHGPATTTE